MLEEVQKLIGQQLRLDPSQVRPESRIKDDLGADSLDVLQMLMTIEEEKGITIPDEELASFTTVQDILNFLEKQQG